MTRQLHTILQRSTVRCAAAGCLLPLALGFAGCGDVNTSSRQISALRIIEASPDAGGLDVYANATALAYNVGFGTVSSYIAFTPGTYTLSAHPSGSTGILSSTRGSLLQSVQYTLLIGNVAAGLQMLLLQDQSQPAPSGQIAIRFIDQATRIGAVDLYFIPQGATLLTTMPIATGVTFNNTTTAPHYVDVPAGSYTIAVLPTGTVPAATTVSSYTGAAVVYPTGSARTIILLDQLLVTTPGVQVITANDYDSATSTS